MTDHSGEDLPSDHAILLASHTLDIFEAAGQLMFEIGEGLAKILGHRAFRPQALVKPRDEKHISEPCVQNRCAGEEVIGVALVDNEETDLVAYPRGAAEH